MASTGFVVSIYAGKDKASSSASATGKVQHVITDQERKTFQLDDKQLKQAVEKSFGKKPNDAYLHSPTPWGDLYKTYHWEQTQTVITATSAEVLEVTSMPMVLKTQTFENNSSHDATYNVTLNESKTDTSTTSWNTGGAFDVKQMVKYELGFLGTGGGGETSFSYSESWGEGGTKSEQVTIGSSAGVSIVLKPGEAVVATLTASQGTMKVRVRYTSRIIGTTAVNYNPTYQGHHFWDLSTPDVMSNGGGISNSIESSEIIALDYFSNGVVETKDKDTNEMRSRYTLPVKNVVSML